MNSRLTHSAAARLLALAAPLALLSSSAAWSQPTHCTAERARYVVGHPYTRELAEDARISAGAVTVRKLELEQAHTTEFRQYRLNLFVDPFGKVTGVRCG